MVSAKEAFNADIVLKVRPPQQNDHLGMHEVDALNPQSKLYSFLQPAINKDLVTKLNDRNVTSFAMD
jgi:NAD/NADP transhydrogenase alpha subunit